MEAFRIAPLVVLVHVLFGCSAGSNLDLPEPWVAESAPANYWELENCGSDSSFSEEEELQIMQLTTAYALSECILPCDRPVCGYISRDEDGTADVSIRAKEHNWPDIEANVSINLKKNRFDFAWNFHGQCLLENHCRVTY